MKKYLLIPVSIIILGMLWACHDENLWDRVPLKAQEFIAEYWPGTTVNAVTETNNDLYVRISDGPGIVFDSRNEWTSIDGYGMPLPQQLLWDQLPEELYTRLEQQNATDGVFAITRTPTKYTAKLLDSTITYNIVN